MVLGLETMIITNKISKNPTFFICGSMSTEFISFDHDLRPKGYVGDFSNGSDCATWLVNYCNENNLSLPRCFVHSANKNGIKNISSILGI